MKNYTTYTRTERRGIMLLLCIIVLLVLVRATMQYWLPTTNDNKTQQMLSEKWNRLQQQKTTISATGVDNEDDIYGTAATTNNIANNFAETDNKKQQIATKLFRFDPNTLDSIGFRQLGLSAKTTGILIHWRSKGKHFYSKEELRKVYTLTEADYQRLDPYISIKQQARPMVNLNTADSLTLLSLPGIGPKLTARILDYRRHSGRFTHFDELRALYHFPDSTFSLLKQRLTLN